MPEGARERPELRHPRDIYLDSKLEALLIAYFINDPKVVKELFGNNGPLGSFSGRIDMSYALGLISSDMRHELHMLRRMRNEFAHEHSNLDFESPNIKNRCTELAISGSQPGLPTRQKFLISFMTILSTLNGAIPKTRHRKQLVEDLKQERRQVYQGVMDDLERSRISSRAKRHRRQ